jgi:hypothetical protein
MAIKGQTAIKHTLPRIRRCVTTGRNNPQQTTPLHSAEP